MIDSLLLLLLPPASQVQVGGGRFASNELARFASSHFVGCEPNSSEQANLSECIPLSPILMRIQGAGKNGFTVQCGQWAECDMRALGALFEGPESGMFGKRQSRAEHELKLAPRITWLATRQLPRLANVLAPSRLFCSSPVFFPLQWEESATRALVSCFSFLAICLALERTSQTKCFGRKVGQPTATTKN